MRNADKLLVLGPPALRLVRKHTTGSNHGSQGLSWQAVLARGSTRGPGPCALKEEEEEMNFTGAPWELHRLYRTSIGAPPIRAPRELSRSSTGAHTGEPKEFNRSQTQDLYRSSKGVQQELYRSHTEIMYLN